jgi:hypothetical protein
MVAEGVGKLAKSPALQKAGNTIYRVSNQPEKRLKDAIRATTPFCKAVSAQHIWNSSFYTGFLITRASVHAIVATSIGSDF